MAQHVRGLTAGFSRNGRLMGRDAGDQAVGWHIPTIKRSSRGCPLLRVLRARRAPACSPPHPSEAARCASIEDHQALSRPAFREYGTNGSTLLLMRDLKSRFMELPLCSLKLQSSFCLFIFTLWPATRSPNVDKLLQQVEPERGTEGKGGCREHPTQDLHRR